ncbi:MAG TPA: hypothetical protein VNU97_03550 [Rhizomicrobium sp.]|jgi:hypothetical protein|nr:hypothetical protein [Rhizomicrobium sp.]
MNDTSNEAAARRVAIAVILAGWIATLASNWPGHLSYDSILQLLQGRTALYNTWHPPVMAWLLGLGDAVMPGAGLFVAFETCLAFGALVLLVLLRPCRTPWIAGGTAVAIVLSPQLLLYQGLVWKDVLFADALVAGFTCLAYGAARWPEVRNRSLWLAASFLLLALAALTRQNGAVLLPFAAAALGWAAARNGMAVRRAALLGALALAALLAFVATSSALLNLRSNGDSGPAGQLRLLQVYDLAGAVAREPSLPLDRLADDDPDLERAIRGDGARLYTPVRNDPLSASPALQAALDNADGDALAADWRALILDHTWLYLNVRAAAFGWVLFTPDIVACRPIFTGVEGPALQMKELGLLPRRDGRDRALDRYGKAFLGTPVLSHAPFAAIAALCLWLLLRRRRPADIALAAMLAGAFAFTLSFFAISIACDYRYLYALDLSALAGLLYLAADARSAIEGTP